MPKLFGTDGVRGVAGVELTADLAHRLGRAAGRALGARRALLARDTRLSGPDLERACAEGLAAAGVDVHLAGVLPSPAVSHLVRLGGYDLGVVISASHNPPEDNGIKFYDREGLKLSPEEEDRVEARLGDPPSTGRRGKWASAEGAGEAYTRFLRGAVPDLSLAGMAIALDCAYGATWEVAPQLFRSLGGKLVLLGAEPDGGRINATGAASLGALQAAVKSGGAELGVAFDGDGDRALFVTQEGVVVEGDRLLAALAPLLGEWGELRAPAVVFTVLANGGAERYLSRRGFRVVRVSVGDRNVSWAMREEGIDLGGEPSGHLVFGRYALTGDGILTALLVLRALRRAGWSLTELVAPVPLDPQVREDVPVRDREAAFASPALHEAVAEAERLLGGKGRIVVRPSGTQPLIRVLAEGPEEGLLRQAVELVVRALEAFR